MDVFDLRSRLVDDYARYTRSFIKIADPRISAKVLPSLQSTNTPEERVWAAHTLVRLVPRDEEILRRLAPYLNDPSQDVSGRIRWIFLAQKKLPRGLEKMLRTIDPSLLKERERLAS